MKEKQKREALSFIMRNFDLSKMSNKSFFYLLGFTLGVGVFVKAIMSSTSKQIEEIILNII